VDWLARAFEFDASLQGVRALLGTAWTHRLAACLPQLRRGERDATADFANGDAARGVRGGDDDGFGWRVCGNTVGADDAAEGDSKRFEPPFLDTLEVSHALTITRLECTRAQPARSSCDLCSVFLTEFPIRSQISLSCAPTESPACAYAAAGVPTVQF
jgi:hypothetical protein